MSHLYRVLVGREKKNKPRGQGADARTGRTWADETRGAQPAPGIWINTAPRTAEGLRRGQEQSCLLRWDSLEWYAGAEDVHQAASDLSTAAAYADLVTELMRAGLDGDTIMQMLQQMIMCAMGDRTPVMGGMMGTADTIGVMPAGSSARKVGLVVVKRGAMAGSLSPGGAREMAKNWVDVASATQHDELVALALNDILDRGAHDQVEAFLGYIAALRDLAAPDREKFRAEEAARLRLHLGLDRRAGGGSG